MKKTMVVVMISLLIYALVNTRLGVFLVFDVVGDLSGSDNLATDTQNGPLKVTRWLAATNTINVPATLEQASGIQVGPNVIWVSTDQAELFKLDHTGNPLCPQMPLLGGPLLFKQGSLEGIWLEGSELHGIGELGAIARWSIQDNSALVLEPTPLPTTIAALEYTGISQYHNKLYAVSDEGLKIYDLESAIAYQPNLEGHLKLGQSVEDLLLSGIAADERYLYLITEAYPSILVVDPSNWTLVEVLGIDPVEASDIAVHEGLAYVTVDHNYFDPRPPIYVYTLAN